MGAYADSLRPKNTAVVCQTCGTGHICQQLAFDQEGRAAQIREQVLRDMESGIFDHLPKTNPPLNNPTPNSGRPLTKSEQREAIARGEKLRMIPNQSDLADPAKVSAIVGSVPVASVRSTTNELIAIEVMRFLGIGIDPETHKRLLQHIRGI